MSLREGYNLENKKLYVKIYTWVWTPISPAGPSWSAGYVAVAYHGDDQRPHSSPFNHPTQNGYTRLYIGFSIVLYSFHLVFVAG